MRWIGLTGGIASGKSSVSRELRSLDVSVVDADSVAHSAFLKSSPVYSTVVDTFGQGVLDNEENIIRSRLAEIVFSNSEKRKALEEIIHPFVRQQVLMQKNELQKRGHSWAVYDVPLLFEQSMETQFDWTIVVTCSIELQFQRLWSRNKISREQAELRIQAQWPLKKKTDLANFTIENNGTLEDLGRRVKKIKIEIDRLVDELD